MNSLLALEGDCIYSPTVSLEVKCLVWAYDIGIRHDNVWNLPDYVVDFNTDLLELYVEQSGYLSQCTNLESL
jgi:hypothetical protein